ncbi:MAG: hypothetical protein ACNYWM_12525, partial [Methanosarcinales archaeon]
SGNIQDSKSFAIIFDKIVERLDSIDVTHEDIVLVIDKGCNSKIKVHSFLCVMGLAFYRLLLWKLKKQEEMLSETRVIEELEKIRVVLVKRGDKGPQFMFETMGLDQMRLFTALGLETVLKET